MVLEGVRLIQDALDAADALPDIPPPAFALVGGSPDLLARTATLRERLATREVPTFEIEPRLLAELAHTETSQGILAVVPIPSLPLPDAPSLILIADGLRDPGNLGTLLRTAAAAGVDAVLLGPGTVDATNPKAVRAAMGAHFRVALRTLDWAGIAELTGSPGSERRPAPPLAIWIADAAGDVDYTAVDWTAPAALIIGGEAQGPSPEARALASGTLRIPLAAGVESLNAATAAAVILFEARRQRVGDLTTR